MRTLKRKPVNRGGFTLVEMIVATLLLAIGVAAAMAAFATINKAGGCLLRSRRVDPCKQKLAEVEQQGDSLTGGDQQGDFGADYPGFRWHEVIMRPTIPTCIKSPSPSVGSGSAPSQRSITTFLRNDLQKQDQADQQLQQNLQNQQTQGATGG